MKFVCDRCQTKYSIADEKVRQKILKIRCKTCDNVITVRDPAAEGAASPAGSSGAAAPASPTSSLGAAQVSPGQAPGVSSPRPADWHLAIDGKEDGPLDLPSLAKKVHAARAQDEVYVWRPDFDGWKPAKEVPAVKAELAKLAGSKTLPPPPLPKPAGAGRTTIPPAAADRTTGPEASAASPGALGRTSSPGAPVGGEASAKRPAAGAGFGSSSLLHTASAGAAAMPGASLGFDDEDRTQISPLDASLLKVDEPAKPQSPARAGAATAGRDPVGGRTSSPALPAVGRTSSPGLPAVGSASMRQAAVQPALFPVVKPNVTGGAPAAARPTGQSQLSQLVGLPGFFGRHPRLKYGVLGGVLVALVGTVGVIAASGDNPPSTEPVSSEVASESPAVDEAQARLEAQRRFGPRPEESKPTVAVVPRSGRPDPQRRQNDRKVPLKAQPQATASLEPPPINKVVLAPPPVGQVADPALQERRLAPAVGRSLGERQKPTGGGFDQKEFLAVVSRNKPILKSCYERALKRDDRLRAGRLDITVTVGLSGTVKAVKCEAPAEFASVSSCIETAVKRLRFPASGEEYMSSFPLVLAGNGG